MISPKFPRIEWLQKISKISKDFMQVCIQDFKTDQPLYHIICISKKGEKKSILMSSEIKNSPWKTKIIVKTLKWVWLEKIQSVLQNSMTFLGFPELFHNSITVPNLPGLSGLVATLSV